MVRQVNRSRTKNLDLQPEIHRRATQMFISAWRYALKTGKIRILQSNGGSPTFLPRMDILDDRDSHKTIAVFELPGVRTDEISLTVHNGMLHVQGRRSPRTPQEYTSGNVPSTDSDGRPQSSANYAVQELRYGAFKRQIKLPDGIKENDITAYLKDGLLAVTWPQSDVQLTNPTGDASEVDVKAPIAHE